MTSRRLADQAILVCAVFITRYQFRSRFLYDVDSVNFALALDRFAPQVHQPQPPGYYLYVCLGRLIYSATHDANSALVWLSIAASCAAVAMIYVLTDTWFGRNAAVFAGALFLLSPLCWFHGIVALVYIVEAFFAALIGYLCWRVYSGENGFAVPSAIALGIAAGVRPSSVVFLGPLWLMSVWKAGPKRAAWSCAALGLTLLTWFTAMVHECGGAGVYFASLTDLWRTVPGKQNIFQAGIVLSVARLVTTAAMYLLCFGSGAVLLLRRFRCEPAERGKKLFTAAWILPGFLFFTLVFLKYVNSGYLLVLSPPAFAWLGCRAARWYSASRMRTGGKAFAIGLAAAANIAFFLTAPVYCSFRGVREFEARLTAIRAELPRLFPPKDTLIVGFDSHFLGYRHCGYYLPEFLTVQYPEVTLAEGRRVFALEHRDTTLLRVLPLSHYKRFVLFPLPDGEEYLAYLEGVRRRFPAALESIRVGRQEFLSGDTRDLPFVFPTTAGAQGHNLR